MTITLAEMRATTRRMSARYTPEQMTDAQIDDYINKSYTIHMPLNFRNEKLNKPFVFLTVPNVDTYQFVYQNGLVTIAQQAPNDPIPVPGNIQIAPPVYCQGYQLRYFEDKSIFYNRWPQLSVNQQIDIGSGVAATVYSGTIPSTPFYRAQLDIFGNVTEAGVIITAFDNTGDATSGFTYSITDVPQAASDVGNLQDSLGNVVGTVNYITGAYTFTPANSTVIPDTATIYAAVTPYQASRPVEILFYNQQIILRPCPLQVYQIEFQTSQQPLELIADGDMPELDEWYLFICAGAAKLIYTDFPDDEGMAYLMPIWQEQLQTAQRRTLRQLSTQRAATLFSQPERPRAGYFFGSAYSGSSA
jgi:hypothetical protein